ncbi:MAG TPA: choice-of-anchor Q domain-containing protein [Candidatus Acidoferrales bacterium]|jgi:hypothetical protein|nr:choice-of-anchor Q domain-containing protein [Candidatus Acidoferrales bacterium]
MPPRFLLLTAVLLALAVVRPAAATTFYVNASNTHPVAPYEGWAAAATNIQDAANYAGPGETILVTNGIYQYGGSGPNRVMVETGVTLQSVNGPAVTTIVGYQMPGTATGPSAIRCVFLFDNATLSGFTLTNGATPTSGDGGGVECGNGSSLVTNCVIVGNWANLFGGGAYEGTLVNCVLKSNFGLAGGGGDYGSALVNCVIQTNISPSYGGGTYFSVLTNCVVSGNSAPNGSGMADGSAYNCLFTGNTNSSAAYLATLYNCTLTGNFSPGLGTADGCTLINSILFYNTNGSYADCYQCKLTNCCTPLGNGNPSLSNNSISNAPAFVDAAHGNYRLQIGSPGMDGGTNVPAAGTTDLDGNPRIVNGTVDMGAYEIQNTNVVHYVCMTNGTPLSPYTNWLTAATNIQDAIVAAQAGDFVVVSNGIYKGGGGIVYGAESNRVVLNKAVTLLGLYGAQSTAIVGSFSVNNTRCVYVGSNSVLNGFTLANGATVSSGDAIKEQSGGGAWCETGGVISNCFFGGMNFQYANNETPGDGCAAAYEGAGVYGGTIYNSTFANNMVNLNGGAAAAAALVNCLIETNHAGAAGGIYQGTATNCIFIGNISTGGSAAAGAEFSTLYDCTVIRNSGYAGGTYNCTNYNCTLANNIASGSGGGAYKSALYNCNVVSNKAATLGGGVYQSTLYSCTVSTNSAPVSGGGGGDASVFYNCTITGNSGSGAVASTLYGCWLAGNTNSFGGGTYNSTLYDCVLTGNGAGADGGGADGGVLDNCTVVGNIAAQGGGIYFATVYNTISYYNVSLFGAATNYAGGILVNCDTTPLAAGFGNFTNDPALVNFAAGDLHLQGSSPCINSGNNLYVTNTTDLDGNPRIAGGTADIGAYEYQTPASVISYAYLQLYGLPTDGSADYADTDGDGMNNWQEWKAGTVPTNAASVLAMSSVSNSVPGVAVSWQSVANVTYFLQRSADLTAPPAFMAIQSNLVGQAGSTTYNDTTATNGNSYFYRVGVQ